MVDLVTTLSPHFTRAYLFGAFALIDAGSPDVAYEHAQEGLRGEPGRLAFPGLPRVLRLPYGQGKRTRTWIAAEWYEKAAAIPGSPAYLPRLAAALLAKGGELEKAVI